MELVKPDSPPIRREADTSTPPKDPRVNQTENLFRYKAKMAGWRVTKKGWPDFILRKNGELCFVEVKRDGPEVSSEQKDILLELANHGFPCYVWTPSLGFLKVTGKAPPKTNRKPRPRSSRRNIPLTKGQRSGLIQK